MSRDEVCFSAVSCCHLFSRWYGRCLKIHRDHSHKSHTHPPYLNLIIEFILNYSAPRAPFSQQPVYFMKYSPICYNFCIKFDDYFLIGVLDSFLSQVHIYDLDALYSATKIDLGYFAWFDHYRCRMNVWIKTITITRDGVKQPRLLHRNFQGPDSSFR